MLYTLDAMKTKLDTVIATASNIIACSDGVKTPALKCIHAYKTACKYIEDTSVDITEQAEARALACYASIMRRDITTAEYYSNVKPDIHELQAAIITNCKQLRKYINDCEIRLENNYDIPVEESNPELFVDVTPEGFVNYAEWPWII